MPRKRVFVRIGSNSSRAFADGTQRIKTVRIGRRKPRPGVLRRAQIAIILLGTGALAFCGWILYLLETPRH